MQWGTKGWHDQENRRGVEIVATTSVDVEAGQVGCVGGGATIQGMSPLQRKNLTHVLEFVATGFDSG